MEASFVKVDITPPLGLRLGGYAHRMGRSSTGVHDPLFARILSLTSSSGEVVVLTQLDFLGIYREEAEALRREISSALKIGEDNVIVSATHTHSSPEVIIPMWPNTFPYSDEEIKAFRGWFQSCLNRMRGALEEGRESEEVRVRMGETKCVGVCRNRTFKGGQVDEELPLVLFSGGKLRVALTSYPCHPVCNTDLGFSADYPGALASEALTRGLEVLFLTGAAGDIDPLKKGRDFMVHMGERLLSSIESATLHQVEPKDLGISRGELRVKLRLAPPLEEARRAYSEALERAREILSKEAGLLEKWDERLRSLLYADEAYEISKRLNWGEAEILVQALRLGRGLAIAFLPGEPFVETGMRIKEGMKRMGYRVSMVVGYSNDYPGYIPVKEAFRIGSYEATFARWSRVTEDAEPALAEKAVEVVSEA